MNEVQKSDSEVLAEEEALKKQCYQYLDKEKARLKDAVESMKHEIYHGAFDSHSEHAVYGEATHVSAQLTDFSSMCSRLERTPYFAHIRITGKEGGKGMDFLLVDGAIDTVQNLSLSCCLVPFALDKDRPMFSALYECYQKQDGQPFTVKNDSYTPEAIRKVDIKNRVLRDVLRLFPAIGEQGAVIYDADEYLAQLILESSGNVDLKSIIATLQKKQFDIIKQDDAVSFVVQGCAGSGKTQILIHRLYYLRTYLSQSGWEHVRLLTPNRFFRKQSAELFSKFNLGGVTISSISDLYVELLRGIDSRFKERHYAFELTEEYLPDEYLSFIYSATHVAEVKQAIINAIATRLSDACHLLERETIAPKDFLRYREELVKGLQKLVSDFDAREKALENDTHFITLRKAVRDDEHRIDQLKQMVSRREQALIENYAKQAAYQSARDTADSARNDIEEWRALHAEESKEAQDKLTVLDYQDVDENNISVSIQTAFSILHQQQVIDDLTVSQRAQMDELLTYQKEADQKILEVTGNISEPRWVAQLDRNIDTIQQELDTYRDELAKLEAHLEENNAELSQYQNENLSEQRKEYRLKLTKALTSIQALESNVFEEEIWNLLAPKKEEYGIETVHITPLDNGRHTETRMLYKFDLLFYLMIYTQLYSKLNIPEISLFCIDEAQDLHEADYSLLHLLYPKAIYNIFGDTQQVVHEAAGVVDWQKETGINTVFTLRKNYRNPASITQMCQSKFHADMDPLGKPNTQSYQETVQEVTFSNIGKYVEETSAVILRGRQEFDHFISALPANLQHRCQYVDTKTTELAKDIIPCYSVFAAKGLEFAKVLVCTGNMTRNQKIVACTRAMEKLYYCEVDNHD